MSIADHPEVGPLAGVILDAIKANMKPGDSAMDVALICVAVASALIVESAAEAPSSVDRRLERAQAFLESMVDHHTALATPLGQAARALTKMRDVEGRNCVIRFPAQAPAPNRPPLSAFADKLQTGRFDPPRGEGGKTDGGDAA